MGPCIVWAPNQDPNTYQLCTLYNIGAHGPDPTRIQQGPFQRSLRSLKGSSLDHTVILIMISGAFLEQGALEGQGVEA